MYANLLMLGTQIPYDLNVHLPGAVVGSPGALGEGGGSHNPGANYDHHPPRVQKEAHRGGAASSSDGHANPNQHLSQPMQASGVDKASLTLSGYNQLERACAMFSDVSNYEKSQISSKVLASIADEHLDQVKRNRSLDDSAKWELEMLRGMIT